MVNICLYTLYLSPPFKVTFITSEMFYKQHAIELQKLPKDMWMTYKCCPVQADLFHELQVIPGSCELGF